MDDVILNLEDLARADIKKSFFYVFFSQGEISLPYLEKIFENGGKVISPNTYYKVPAWINNKYCSDIYNKIALKLKCQPKGEIQELSSIMQAIDATKDLDGDYVEIGVFSGTSALVAIMYSNILGIKRNFYLLDTYSGFNYENAKNSQDVKWFGTHMSWQGSSGKAAIKRIVDLTSDIADTVYPINFDCTEDLLPKEINRIAMANLDVDMYEATYRGLNILAPLIVKNGIITTEDPVSTHGLHGAYYALHKFLKTDLGRKFISLRSESTYFLIKKAD